MTDRVEKLRKILEPSSGSSENEKQVAAQILEKYKAQGIDIDAEDKFYLVELKFKGDLQERLLHQLLHHVLGERFKSLTGLLGTNAMKVNLTRSEEIELREKFEFYSQDLEKAVLTLYSAWVQKNRLFSDAPLPDDNNSKKEWTAEEMEMYRAIKSADFHKKLTN